MNPDDAKHLTPAKTEAERAARLMMDLTPDERVEVMDLFCGRCGQLEDESWHSQCRCWDDS